MPFAPEDLQAIHEVLAPIIGHEAWSVHVGYGACLTIHFGAGTTKTRATRSGRQWSWTRGEWDIWTDSCVWRIEDATGVLAAYEDPRPLMDSAFARLNGSRLLSIDLSPTSADTVFTFDDGVLLRLFSIYMDPDGDQAHWMLFAPTHQVLVIGPSSLSERTKLKLWCAYTGVPLSRWGALPAAVCDRRATRAGNGHG